VSYSPLVEGDLVIVQPGGKKDNSVAAFHKDTGKLVWTAGDGGMGYASAIVATIQGQRTLIVPTGQNILGIEPVKGTILWRYVFGNQFNATCSNPVWSDDTLFVSAAYGTGCAALTVSKESETWEVKEKWKDRKSLLTLYSTSVAKDGHLFGSSGDLGAIFLRCVNLAKGDLKWNERLDSRSHLILVDNHLLVWSERGNLSVVAPQADKFERLHHWPEVLEYKSWAAPALANGRLYLRDEKHALCLDLRK
jgi:outer membrane protein assembly factor BamB